MNRLNRMAIGLAALALAAVIPAFVPGMHNLTWASASAVAVLYAFGILSVVILTGYVGQVSLCQATFMGISDFTTAAMVNHFNLNFFLAATCGLAAAFLLGVIVGIPALRLRGILLAIVTVGVALGFDDYFFKDAGFAWFNGGIGGWPVPGTRVFGATL